MTSYIHEEIHDKGSYIESVEYIYFYDFHLKLWTIIKYGNGEQKGESQYLNNRDEVPRSSVLVVLGVTVVALTTKSCAGPKTVTGPPSADVPSCVCPLVEKAVTIASNSPSKSAALITAPSAMLLSVSFLV